MSDISTPEAERRRRRRQLLEQLAEGRALRERLAPRKARLARHRDLLHQHMVRV